MITLHHLNYSRSFRILWLLEELKLAYGLNYELVCHERNKQFLAPDSLKQVNGVGKAPILIDDGQVLMESAFIIEYLLKKYDKDKLFKPVDGKAWEYYTFWLHFSESSMMPPLVMRLVLDKTVAKSPFFIKPIANILRKKIEASMLTSSIRHNLDLLENHLKQHTWLAGSEFSAADIQAYFGLSKGDKQEYTSTWLKRCEQRDAFIRAVALGGKPVP